ncbi:MAG: hypothetical protein AAGA20_01400, partial [Planctomycetota bacterium]
QPGDLVTVEVCLETPGTALPTGGFLHPVVPARTTITTPYGEVAADPTMNAVDAFIRKDPGQDLLSVQARFEGAVTVFAIIVDDNSVLLPTDVLDDLVGTQVSGSALGGNPLLTFSDGPGMVGCSLDTVAFEACGLDSTTYCTGNPNSTGVVGGLVGTGSNEVAANDVTLIATDLPPTAFGYFLVSEVQGFVANPGGSEGNLCLSGSVGRYSAVGQIGSAGPDGTFSLSIDLTQIPTPSGFVAAMPSDTWNFQAWHRDAGSGGPTSNFTLGLAVTFE